MHPSKITETIYSWAGGQVTALRRAISADKYVLYLFDASKRISPALLAVLLPPVSFLGGDHTLEGLPLGPRIEIPFDGDLAHLGLDLEELYLEQGLPINQVMEEAGFSIQQTKEELVHLVND